MHNDWVRNKSNGYSDKKPNGHLRKFRAKNAWLRT
jgi:hypothetical protein